jgi:sugar transport system substrate-binding protein
MNKLKAICRFSLFILMLWPLLSLWSCRGPAESGSAPGSKTTSGVVVGAVLFGRDSFFENIQKGMEAAAKAGGIELLVSIHDHDINKETEFIENYIARKVQAIVITPESVDASTAAIKQAHDAGIRVICFNTCINPTDAAKYVSAFYETDQASLGYQTGEYLAGWWAANMPGKEIRLGILQCERFETCKRRGEGFRKALKDKGVVWKEAAIQEGWMPDEGSTAAEGMLQSESAINLLWSENEGGTVGEVVAVRSMNLTGKVFVFGTDISPQLAEMLSHPENILQAVTGQSPREMGSVSIRAAVSIVEGQKGDFYHNVPNAFFSRSDPGTVRKYLQEYNR